MTKEANNPEVITIGIKVHGVEHELKFKPTLMDYNKYTNDISMSDKVAPSTRYLRRVVCDEDKKLLNELLNKPGVATHLAGELNEEYTGIEIEVKK